MHAHAPRPNRCHNLGLTDPSTHSPSTAVTEVNREMANANGIGWLENQITSGIMAAAKTKTAQSSSGARNAHRSADPLASRKAPYAKQMTPKIRTTHANFT